MGQSVVLCEVWPTTINTLRWPQNHSAVRTVVLTIITIIIFLIYYSHRLRYAWGIFHNFKVIFQSCQIWLPLLCAKILMITLKFTTANFEHNAAHLSVRKPLCVQCSFPHWHYKIYVPIKILTRYYLANSKSNEPLTNQLINEMPT